jgi:hypothetical protein
MPVRSRYMTYFPYIYCFLYCRLVIILYIYIDFNLILSLRVVEELKTHKSQTILRLKQLNIIQENYFEMDA